MSKGTDAIVTYLGAGQVLGHGAISSVVAAPEDPISDTLTIMIPNIGEACNQPYSKA